VNPKLYRLTPIQKAIPVVAGSKEWVCGRLLAGIAGSNPAGGMDVCIAILACCQLEVCATG